MKQENETFTQARVTQAYEWYVRAREELNKFILNHKELFEEYQHHCELVNERRKKLEMCCREARMGVGEITVSVAQTPVYHIDLLEEKLAGVEFDGRPVLEDLITVKKSVKREVFDRLVKEGVIDTQVAIDAVERVDMVTRLRGMPTEISVP